MSQKNDPSSNYAPNVRAQYEDYPFPLRDPRDESKRLVVTELDCLAKLNHYCFGGRQGFSDEFRVLVAGGGTGDHTIFLAERLRDYAITMPASPTSTSVAPAWKLRKSVPEFEAWTILGGIIARYWMSLP